MPNDKKVITPQLICLRSFFALNVGSYYAWDGHINKAADFLQEAVRTAVADGNLYLAYLTMGQLGYYQRDWGWLSPAVETFRQALNLATHAPISGWIYLGLAQELALL